MGSQSSKSKNSPSGSPKSLVPTRTQVLPHDRQTGIISGSGSLRNRLAKQPAASSKQVAPDATRTLTSEKDVQEYLRELQLQAVPTRTGSGLSFASPASSQSTSPTRSSKRRPSMHIIRPSSPQPGQSTSEPATPFHSRSPAPAGESSAFSFDLLNMRSFPTQSPGSSQSLPGSRRQSQEPWIVEDLETNKKYRVWGPDAYGANLIGTSGCYANGINNNGSAPCNDVFVEELDSRQSYSPCKTEGSFSFVSSSRRSSAAYSPAPTEHETPGQSFADKLSPQQQARRHSRVGSVEIREIMQDNRLSELLPTTVGPTAGGRLHSSLPPPLLAESASSSDFRAASCLKRASGSMASLKEKEYRRRVSWNPNAAAMAIFQEMDTPQDLSLPHPSPSASPTAYQRATFASSPYSHSSSSRRPGINGGTILEL